MDTTMWIACTLMLLGCGIVTISMEYARNLLLRLLVVAGLTLLMAGAIAIFLFEAPTNETKWRTIPALLIAWLVISIFILRLRTLTSGRNSATIRKLR